MEGKADMLLANRTLSALIVVCMLFSGFAGFLFLADAPPAKAQSGDLIVSGTYTIQDIVQPVDGNVVINSGGNLIIRDATLSVISNQNPSSERHTITVNAGGTLTLDHGTITTYQDQLDPWPFLSLIVNGGTVSASASSMLRFPGSITLTANAQVTLDDTIVTALDSYLIPTGMDFDQVDDGPSITMTDSTLKLFDSSILMLPEYGGVGQPASNITLNGNSNLLGVNSEISIDFGPVLLPTDWSFHNLLDLRDTSRAYLYGCWFAPYDGDDADRAPAIVTYPTSGATGVPSTKGAADNTGDVIGDLAAIDGATYDVAVGQTMEIDTWSVAFSDAQPVADAVLSMTYTASPTYTGTVAVQWAAQGSSYQSTTIIPVPPGATSTYNLPMASILTAGDIRNMNLRFSPVGGSGSVQFDRARITFDVGSD
ncbi:MAG TPA: hypothetical protein VJ489_02115, partial [Thermoplasmata archaeon]|nr:hypothetical protein [Thermoplasmata archaeon]